MLALATPGSGGHAGTRSICSSSSFSGSSGSSRGPPEPPTPALIQAIKETETPQQLLALLHQHAANMNPITVNAAFVQAKRLCTGVLPEQQPAAAQQLLQHLHQLAKRQKQQCGASQLANIMWASAKLGLTPTVQLLLPVFLQQANPQAVSNTLWACASLGMQLTESQLQQLVQQFISVLPQAKPQDVSNMLWACAQHLFAELPAAGPQVLVNTLWARARLGLELTQDQVQQELVQLCDQLPQADSQQVANLLWAYATLEAQLPLPDY